MTDMLMTAVQDSLNRYGDLAKEAAQAVERAELDARQARRAQIVYRHGMLRETYSRLHTALVGLERLTEFRESEQVQKLISLRGNLTLYCCMDNTETEYSVCLKKDGISLSPLVFMNRIVGRFGVPEYADSDTVTFTTADHFLNSRLLLALYSEKEYDILGFEYEDETYEERYERLELLKDASGNQLLFQVLVDCSQPERFLQYAKFCLQ